MRVWKARTSTQSRATSKGSRRRRHRRVMRPRMASATWTRRLAQKRWARLMRCLQRAGPVSLRPKAARLTRLVRSAASTRAARVLAWLLRRAEHTERTQAMAAACVTAVPPRRGGQEAFGDISCTAPGLRQEPPPSSQPAESGGDSALDDLDEVAGGVLRRQQGERL